MQIKRIDMIVEKLEGKKSNSYWLVLYHLLAGLSLVYASFDLINYIFERI